MTTRTDELQKPNWDDLFGRMKWWIITTKIRPITRPQIFAHRIEGIILGSITRAGDSPSSEPR
jgi:hypothetical protein